MTDAGGSGSGPGAGTGNDRPPGERDDLHRVAPVADLQPGDRVMREIRGLEIGVFNVDGDYYALANYCMHQGGPGCEGRITGMLTETDDGRLSVDRRGEIVSCPWHGWEYDIRTGEHLADPSLQLPTFEVVVHDGAVYVRR